MAKSQSTHPYGENELRSVMHQLHDSIAKARESLREGLDEAETTLTALRKCRSAPQNISDVTSNDVISHDVTSP